MTKKIKRYPRPGKTYYVDRSGGNDSNRGTSPALAWQTISQVNTASTGFKPGDRILFKAGEIWTGTTSLIPSPTAPGTERRYIYFGSYGSGVNPKIGRNTNYGIVVSGTSYLIFDKIDSHYGTRNYYVLDSHHIIIKNCSLTATTVDEASINILSSAVDDKCYNVIVDSVYISGTTGWGVAPGGSIQVKNISILNSTFQNVGVSGSVQHHGIYATNVNNLLIKNNTIDASWNGAIKLVESGGKTLSGIIYGNKCTRSAFSKASGIDISFDGITHPLLIACNYLADGDVDGNGSGITPVNNPSTGIEIYYNTIVRHYIGLNLIVSPSGWVVKYNNIVQDFAWEASSLRCAIYTDSDATIANNTFDGNNLWFNDGASSRDPVNINGTAISLATWNGKTGVGTDTSVDPLFVTEYTDLHLQSGSTLRDVGVLIAGIPVDKDSVPLDSSPDIGCYQYV